METIKFSISLDYNPKQKRLGEMLKSTKTFNVAIEIALELHQIVHEKYQDMALFNKTKNMVSPNKKTIAYSIWHITRIEDICVGMLINKGKQVFDADWQKRMNSSITDTGNELSFEEIKTFTDEINFAELLEYRKAVGTRTIEILRNLKPNDIKRKVSHDDLDRVLSDRCVSTDERAFWLLDFWGKKNVGGLIMMPLTRHQMVHLSDCLKAK